MSDLFYGKSINKQEKGKRAIFEHTTDSGKIVGEITLEKNPLDEICNICLSDGPLSLDHVPPDCTGNNGRMKYQSAFNNFLAKDRGKRGICQNGIQFKTICAACNNKLGDYDAEFRELFHHAITNRRSKGTRPYIIELRPNKILRGLCGHLLSAKTTHTQSGLDKIFQKVVNPNFEIPDSLNFYVFPYYHESIKILRDFGFAGFPPSRFIQFYILKIYPLCFIITDKPTFPDWPSWNEYRLLNPETKVPVRIFGTKGCEEDWPENGNYWNCGIVLGRTSGESIIGEKV